MDESGADSGARVEYLVHGRRVTVADLVRSGHLQGGMRLVYNRPRLRQTHRATVTEDGRIRLEDGREFSSPSRAAADAAAIPAVDGWHVWVAEDAGQSLDGFRQAFLDEATTDQAGDGVIDAELAAAQRRHEEFKHARELADHGTSWATTGRDLIALWGARRRSSRLNEQIETELANHGLTTSPSFRKVTLDAMINLVAIPEEVEQREEGSDALLEETTELDVGLTVGNLPSALGGITSVSPNATFDEAITLMRLNDYSQLAVLSGSHTLRGAVTWKSIAKVRHANPDASFADAIERALEVRYDQELIDILATLYDADFVFVRNEKNEVSGIVTTADVVQAYGELATPFFLIGELDQVLRWVVRRNFALSDVARVCEANGDRSIRSFDDLTIGDYQRVLENPDNWRTLGWRLDRVAFTRRLDEIREIRNDIAHFNPDPLPSDAVAKLRHFLKLLREYSD